MSSIVIYDSVFGNTAEIARAIATALEPAGPVRLVPAGEAKGLSLDGVDLLVVGSPTRGFRPTPAMDEILARLEAPAGRTLRAAVFDTRLDAEQIHPVPLRWVVNAGGYAAQRMAQALRERGIEVTGAEGGFMVTGAEGPLKPGELERAGEWARAILG